LVKTTSYRATALHNVVGTHKIKQKMKSGLNRKILSSTQCQTPVCLSSQLSPKQCLPTLEQHLSLGMHWWSWSHMVKPIVKIFGKNGFVNSLWLASSCNLLMLLISSNVLMMYNTAQKVLWVLMKNLLHIRPWQLTSY